MNHNKAASILRMKRQGYKLWAIAQKARVTEAEAARVLMQDGLTLLNIDHPQQRRSWKAAR